jgi:hypothetical protein
LPIAWSNAGCGVRVPKGFFGATSAQQKGGKPYVSCETFSIQPKGILETADRLLAAFSLRGDEAS